ncbi:MAG: 4Fe-4S dicluster domain-containing protein [Deltaproteobacteria bacterium]|nr:4Fe-4S dicluster domain-containing protein [Deltaproteobacteria bacterium]
MDQKELRILENRCIQEEPPECMAACPIHVDARAFVGHMGRGACLEAWKVLRKTMPFPAILGRICDAPCRDRCKRREAGQAIEIGRLERVCVKTPAPKQRVLALPKKEKRVAIAGSDLDSLTAAWDLSRKGYGVTLFASGDRPGGGLLELPEAILPQDVVAEEIHELVALGVEIRLNSPLHDQSFLSDLPLGFDAVYLGLNIGAALRDENNGVFAYGYFQHETRSPVWLAAEGRRAATSMDRYLQKVSLTAGREKEGPYPTRLYTRTDGVIPLPAVQPQDPVHGFTPDETIREAGRCLQCQCLECVKVCAYLERFGAYPKKYAREIYNNASIVIGSRQANKLINSCSLCGLCEAVCPEDFAMQTLCLEARKDMVQKGKMPPSAHEFALLDMAFSNSAQFAMVRHEPGHKTSASVFFPGCQLSASDPAKVKSVYAHLRRVLSGGVGLMLGCCNVPASWAGQEDQFQTEFSRLRDQWIAMGSPRIIPACSTCYRIFKTHLPEAGILSLWQVLEEKGLPEDSCVKEGRPLAVHDPCTTRHEPGLQQNVRSLLHRLGQSFEELELGRNYTECCGFGGLMKNANPDLAKTVVQRVSGKSSADYLTYCAGCRDNLAVSGKRAVHILDLIFPDAAVPDPGVRKRPGWSQGQENRIRLKEELLNEVWQEGFRKLDDLGKIVLSISPEIQQILEDRRILISDIQKVIHHAESTGETLIHPVTGHCMAAFKPYKTTFWVEYSVSGSGFILHNAYSHRMEVAGKGQS